MREPESLAVVDETAQRCLPAIPEDEQPPREGIRREHLATDAREPIDAFAEIDGLDADEDPHLGRDLDHRA